MKPAYFSFLGLAVWLILAVAAYIQVNMLIYWYIFGLGLFVCAFFDAWSVWRLPILQITRHVQGSLSLGVWSEVYLSVHNQTSQQYVIDIFDDYPLTADLQGLPQNLSISGTSTLKICYKIRPKQRGTTQFSGIHVLLSSPLRFWKYARYITLKTSIRVYPNFSVITKYALFATENKLGQLGIRKLQRRGEGLEFQQLREYRSGDALRQIDWNATSRQKKLISKEYQDERDQQIVFLIDCGRGMLAQDGTLSHFDHTLNAILLLSYVALRQGDALGLMSFSGEERWLAPRKSMNTLNIILNTVYDLQPTTHTSDYLRAATQLIHRLKKRSLVILISNLRDDDNDELYPALQILRQKHLVLVGSLQERIFKEVLDKPVNTFDDAIRHTACLSYLNARHQAHDTLKKRGLMVLDTEPEQLPVMMVNRYLEIKRRGVL